MRGSKVIKNAKTLRRKVIFMILLFLSVLAPLRLKYRYIVNEHYS